MSFFKNQYISALVNNGAFSYHPAKDDHDLPGCHANFRNFETFVSIKYQNLTLTVKNIKKDTISPLF